MGGSGHTGGDVAVFVVDIAYDEGREECQEEIPEPVGGGRECALLGAGARWGVSPIRIQIPLGTWSAVEV